ncbi:MAG: site-2 protease family protein [Acidobacteriaceae bacterium]|nr:site-2 protease family protein [Acidobacteriaceae bacterium]
MAEQLLNAEAAENGSTNPQAIHNCPGCELWLGDGTALVCPECGTLTYGQHLTALANQAQALEQADRFPEALGFWREMLRWLPEETQQAATIRQHIAQIQDRLDKEQERESRWKKRLGPLAPVLLFLFKAKSALFVLFKIKFLLGFLSFFSFYWLLFGWKFALGFTAMLMIHEMGHYLTLKRRGYKPELPILIPFLGAYVRWFAQDVAAEELALVSLAGPAYGLVAALLCLGIWLVTHHAIFLVLANVGAWINLFNLLPLGGLDGSKATYALGKLQRLLITATCLIFFGLTVNAANGNFFGPMTQWVFAFVGAGMLWRCFTADEPAHPDTRTMVYFLGLLLALGFTLLFTLSPLALLHQAGF